ncbi:MAG: hypothetical protein AAF597_12350 [Bacteroidota bacterium]
MPFPPQNLLLVLLVGTLLSGCTYYGEYHYSGEFANAQLPAKGKKIGILDPRGPYGNSTTKKELYQTLKATLGKCRTTRVLTEDGMHDRGEAPPIYNDYLSEDNLRWFVEETTIDSLVWIDVGPGKITGGTVPYIPTAHQEVSAVFTVYDLNDGSLLKEIIVNGTMDFGTAPSEYQIEATVEQMGTMALRKGLHRLRQFSDCR